MEQHPIPQQISSYQFRLVGDMTLKQFFQLAGGILVGLIFYSSPLLAIIKWPLAIISVILGIGLAFLPLEERPLETWIFAFFRAIYAPTLFYWDKTQSQEKFFQDEEVATTHLDTDEKGAPQGNGPLQKLEVAEKGFLSTLSNLFQKPTEQAEKVVSPASQPAVFQAQPQSPVQAPQNVVNPPQVSIPQPQVPQPPPPPMEKPKPVPFNVPFSQPIKIIPEFGRPKMIVEERSPYYVPSSTITTGQVAPTIAGNEYVSTRQAIFSVDAAPPNPPTSPNVIVGQVVDIAKHIVEGAVMEIRDSGGRPIRALRSNKLGHFIIVTPLDNGRYDLITEKDGYEFSPVSFEAKGEIIPPILVSGKINMSPEPVVNSVDYAKTI